MKKWRSIMVMAAAFALALLPAEKVSAHYNTAYYHEEQLASNNADWMSGLRDNARLSELSIPGTHDSMSHRSDLSFVDNTRTQTMNLQQQLDSGIRYIDIRVKYTDTGFPLHHGIVYLGYDFENVLQTVQTFLQQHPGETIIMRLKQENSSASDSQMKKVFDTYYYNRYQSLFWKPTGEKDPTPGSMRGKLVLMSDVLSLNVYGLNYRDVNTQDYYDLGTNWDLYSKWEKVKEHAKKGGYYKQRSHTESSECRFGRRYAIFCGKRTFQSSDWCAQASYRPYGTRVLILLPGFPACGTGGRIVQYCV